MKSLLSIGKTSLSSKLILVLFIGSVPFITNCSKAKYGETAQQAPVPTIVPPRPAAVAPAARAAPPVAHSKTSGNVKSVDEGPSNTDSDSGTSGSSRSTHSYADTDSGSTETPHTHITINNGNSNPCGVCSAPRQQQQVVVQTSPQSLACEGGSCQKSHFVQSYVPSVQDMDILFVVDSTQNLQNERFALFHHIESFLKFLPTGMNYRFAVLNTQDIQTSLYATPSNPNQVMSADLMNASEADRDARFEVLKKDIWDRIATMNTVVFEGSSLNTMRLLDRAVSSPALQTNQANGFFRNTAGLVIFSLTDETVKNQVLHRSCEDTAGNLYQKIANLKHLSISAHIEQALPIEFIGFAYLSSNQEMNSARGVPYSSDMLQLLHLGDAVLFDLAPAIASPEQMKADLRYAGGGVSDTWMKKRFQIRADTPIDPSTVCFVANGELIATNFVPEINEVRIDNDPRVRQKLETAAASGLSTEILWCENGKTRNNSAFNTFQVNATCRARLEQFRASGN